LLYHFIFSFLKFLSLASDRNGFVIGRVRRNAVGKAFDRPPFANAFAQTVAGDAVGQYSGLI
jgi:hypothetical protein